MYKFSEKTPQPLDQCSDETLCQLVAGGSREAEEALVTRYNRLVRTCARPFFLVGGDSEDLIQEGMLGLLAAIRGFQSGKETSFRTYAEICVRSRLYAAVRAAQRVLRTDAIPASPSAGAALHAAAQLIANGKSRSALAVFSARQNIL